MFKNLFVANRTNFAQNTLSSPQLSAIQHLATAPTVENGEIAFLTISTNFYSISTNFYPFSTLRTAGGEKWRNGRFILLFFSILHSSQTKKKS